ncbi:uncharacterized protein K452DRAFT_302076 [Aplosporella prunicola CBS 121167]|uniref:Uncharacterized protein n=1 Tax=Aplosporella prunicola CBS 121167 TaxID=1176127 RepID=A0A6A6B170_9PEZI|nr:uncharacterized protein K452DRAFT_302076 [Aplosporella prunicola CBS 121167]KAF2137318.1 hypothetical protein K452DRAFT_302076 [Aplosporella prunicola CBS 121167]
MSFINWQFYNNNRNQDRPSDEQDGPSHRYPTRHSINGHQSSAVGVNQSQLENLRNENNRLHTKVDNQRREIQIKERKWKNVVQQKKNLEAQNLKFKELLNGNSRDTSDIEERILHYKQRNEYLEAQANHMQEKLDACMIELRSAQQTTFEKAKTVWAPEEDRTIRELIEELFKSVRAWSKKHCAAVSDWSHFEDEETLKKLFCEIQVVADIPDMNALIEFKHPFLVLASLLSSHITEYIFRNPFLFLEDSQAIGTSSSPGYVLNNTFQRLSNANKSEAHSWRVEFLRVAFPSTTHNHFKQKTESPLANQEDPDCIYASMVDKFIYGSAYFFLNSLTGQEEAARKSDLHALFLRAGNINGRIQSQLTHFEWVYQGMLLNHPFSVHSLYMKADRFHKLEDDEDKSHDGDAVKIIVSPMVKVYGDSNGENYESGRLLVKAVVWLGDPDMKVQEPMDSQPVKVKTEPFVLID